SGRSTRGRSLGDLHGSAQLAGVLGGDADDALTRALRDAGAGLERGPVVRDRDGLARRNPAPAGVAGRELDLGGGALELELGDSLDRRAREEGPVADEAQALAFRGGLAGKLRCGRFAAGAQRRLFADLAEGQAVVDPLRDFGEDGGRVRGDLDGEALRQLRDPGELVGGGWDHGSADALQSALEVDVGAVSLEVARPGKDEVGPADGQALEQRV